MTLCSAYWMVGYGKMLQRCVRMRFENDEAFLWVPIHSVLRSPLFADVKLIL